MRPRAGFRPVPQHRYMKAVADAWRALPAFGCFHQIGHFADGKLQLFELRLMPERVKLKAWGDTEDNWELAVSVVATLVEVAPPEFAYQQRPLVIYGLHALGRRFERGNDRSVEAIIADLLGTAIHKPSGEFEFRIPARSGGHWVGSYSAEEGKTVALVRTFLAW